MKVATKLIVLLTLAVTAVTVLSSYFSSKQYLANVEKRHSLVADVLLPKADSDDFREAMRTGDHLYFQSSAGVFAGNAQIRWVWLEAYVPARFRPISREILTQDVKADVPISLIEVSKNGVRALHTYFPLAAGGRIGAIEITSRLSEVDEQARQTWFNAILTIGAMSLLSIGMIMTAGVRWIARPLDMLIKKMQRVGEGDFASDLEIRSKDELGELAAEVNQMCNRLRAQQAEIEFETAQKIRAIEQLRHSDRLKTIGQLAAGVAHEVGTPLNVVSGRASMILDNDKLSVAEVHKNAQAIKTESERISAIVQKLLHFARRSPSQKNTGDLRETISHSVDLLRPLADKRKVKLECHLGDEPANSEFDFGQLQQVWINLIDNAVDASPENGTVKISISRSGVKAGWSITISDQGIGIPVEQQAQVFEPFYTTKETGSGTGLGLSIAHGIVADHGGEIQIESEPGNGATFRVELPMAPEENRMPT